MTSPAEDALAPPLRADNCAPEPETLATEGGDTANSLLEDVEALIEDGRTYLEAELGFQKTRAAYVADRVRAAATFGAVAVLLAFLALIGLTVGLILALTPLLTAWGASALVVALLALAAALCVRAAARRWTRVMAALDREPGKRS